MDMNDVRVALWRAYKKRAESEGEIDGKSSEGYCELLYPTYWECNTEDEFKTPHGIMIYSYALGPNRKHYIYCGIPRKADSNIWYSPDIYRKAVEVINSWMEDEDAE